MSLAVIFIVGFFGLGTALTIATIALVGLNKNYNTTSGNQTFYTAEAAAREGAYQCINSFYVDPSNPCLDSTNTIPFDINMVSGTTTIKNLTWPYVEIKSIANNNLTQREVVYNLTKFAEGLAFDYAVFSENNMNLGGSAIINGNVFASNTISFTGSNAEINGDAFSPNDITDTDNINGTAYSGVIPIPAPQIDLQPYYDAAVLGGTLFATASDTKAYLNGNTITAVIFVEDTDGTKISNTNTNLSGSLVTQGDLDLTGGTYTATNNYAAIVVEGSLKIAGGTIINGIVYVKGSTSFGRGDNAINGSLISVGGTSIADITGHTTINFSTTTVANWQNLTGLSTTTSAVPPLITQWGEQ